VEQLARYVQGPNAARRRGAILIPLYVGLALLLAGASLVAVNSRGGHAGSLVRMIPPHAGSACTSPPNGYLYSNTVDGTLMKVCVSQEGNINGFSLGSATNQIAWDGYCLQDNDTFTRYTDYSPGSAISFSGWNAATLTVAASNQLNVTRTTTDGKYQLTEFIKMNFQPRSVFVGMTIKNVDPANVTHRFYATRSVAPAIDGSAADDEYNEFGVGFNSGSSQFGRTGQAYGGTAGNSLLFGPTQEGGAVMTTSVSFFQSPGNSCFGANPPGHYGPSNPQVLTGQLGDNVGHTLKQFTLAQNQSAQVGKFVYRMM
jgi:hypothetical protein